MNKLNQLIQHEIDFTTKTSEQIEAYSHAAEVDAEAHLINLQMLGNMMAVAARDDITGYFTMESVELFGHFLSGTAETIQFLNLTQSNADFELKNRQANGGSK